MVYINHNTFSAPEEEEEEGGGGGVGGVRRHEHLFFVCILFQNIKLNQSFNTLDCINTGGEVLE